ncbi:lysophospholipase [Bisporella sp. PMI_857]|nr:lysophospholipase [Bisporella sp. PMI_857]
MLYFQIFVATASLVAGVSASYAPVPAKCPSSSMVRTSTTSLSSSEESYRTVRKFIADLYLRAWLLETSPELSTAFDMPTVALTSSGGGYRAMLIGAGVIQALDSRDSSAPTSGLYQALTYHSGLSGGSWLLSSIASNNFPKISSLLSTWKPALENGLFAPGGLNNATIYNAINDDLDNKTAAGFPSVAVDAWSRLLSYQLLPGPNGGVANTMSAITSMSRFITRSVPYPIITAQTVDLSGTSCIPPQNASVWEFTPYEFGSWDPTVGAFTPTAYLGSSLSGGAPVSSSSCFTKYDNLGYVLGTSSALFNDPGIGTENANLATFANFCTIPASTNVSADAAALATGVNRMLSLSNIQLQGIADLFAPWPNPFYKLSSAPQVSAMKTLSMVDGGESGQVNPIFPFLLPARNVDVIIVNDNDDDTSLNFPNGREMVNTYNAAMAAGLTRMPFIPPVSTFVSQNLTGHPVFFGCHNTSVATIVWVPNAPMTPIGGGTNTAKMQYSAAETVAMVANGAAVMSQNNSVEWARCLGCAIMDSTGSSLPSSCTACLQKYCFVA